MNKKTQPAILRIVICLILIFIPTYIAIASACQGPKKSYSEKKHEVVAVTLKDTNGAEFSASKVDDTEGLVGIFNSIFTDATKVSALSDSVRKTPAFDVSVRHADENTDERYRFYFNPEATSYFEDSAGLAYGVKDDGAQLFYRTSAAACLFSSAVVPAFKNIYGTAILPNTMSWSYLDGDKNYRPASVSLAEEEQVIETDGSFTFSFDIQPDFVKATLRKGDTTVYDGALDGIAASVTVTEQTRFDMTVTAEWYEDASRSYKGSATYAFVAEAYAQADFSLGENRVEAGQIAVINAKNIRDASLIQVTVEPPLRYRGQLITPVFCGEGDSRSALLPIPATCFSDNAQSGKTMTYEITVSYGTQSYSLHLDVSARNAVTPRQSDATKAAIAEKRTDDVLASVYTLYAETAKTSADRPLYGTDQFYRYYEDGKKNFSLAFGKSWKYSDGAVYVNDGVDFKIKANTDIVATASGKVVAVGENAYLGKYIAVDHGMGLQSWYLHLGSASVSVADNVSREQVIGKSGTTGFLPHSEVGFTLVYTVYGVPVCSYAQTSGKGLEETGLNLTAFPQA